MTIWTWLCRVVRPGVVGFGLALALGGCQVIPGDGPWMGGAQASSTEALPFDLIDVHEIDVERQAVMGFALQKSLELGARSHGTVENEISALQQRAHVSHSELSEEIPQVGHADWPMAADVDAADERDVG